MSLYVEYVIVLILFHVEDLAHPAVKPAVIQSEDSPCYVLFDPLGGVFDDYPVGDVLVAFFKIEV